MFLSQHGTIPFDSSANGKIGQPIWFLLCWPSQKIAKSECDACRYHQDRAGCRDVLVTDYGASEARGNLLTPSAPLSHLIFKFLGEGGSDSRVSKAPTNDTTIGVVPTHDRAAV